MGRLKAAVMTLWLLPAFLAVSVSRPCFAQNDSSATAAGTQTGNIIEQVVASGFRPDRVLMLRENGLGEVRQHVASYILRGGEQRENYEQIFVGARLGPNTAASHAGKMLFTFFLIGNRGDFAATPITGWTMEQIRENNRSVNALLEESSTLEAEFKSKQVELTEVEAKLGELRNRASQIAGVDEIIDVKMKLTQVRGYGADNEVEQRRLRDLVERGRAYDEPDNSRIRVQQLSQQLAETARVTALAERLNARRREAARESVERKIALVQEMRGVDAEALAREVLRLRSERRELEAQLGPATTAEDIQF